MSTPARKSPKGRRIPFVSPINVTTSPKAKDAQNVKRIVANGEAMCRIGVETKINMQYLKDLLADDANSLWTIRDSDGELFGFGITSFHGDHIKLHLICTIKRKGEGSQLFRNILVHALENRVAVKLEAISTAVAKIYAKVAFADKRWGVFIGRKRVSTIADVETTSIMTLEGYTPMEFHPRKYVPEPQSPKMIRNTAVAMRKAKARMRRMEDSDYSSDDGNP